MLSYIEISKENLIHNFKAFRNFVHGETKIAAVIKANAYGHGQNEVAEILEDFVDYFQVDDVLELRLLRQVSGKPTLVLGYVAEDEINEAIELEGILGVYDIEQLKQIDKCAAMLGRKALVHVKIDASLGRQGVLVEDAENFSKQLKNFKNITVDGIYSHFANIEDTSDFSHAQKQIDNFNRAVEIFKAEGFEKIKTHISASSGIMVYEKNLGQSNIVRLGISLYGMWPSDELKARFEERNFHLKPVMRWITHIAQVKTVPENYSIGYGLTFITNKPTKIAVIPQGYSDGYDRGLSNQGEVLISGRRCKVLGRVAMNMFVVDVSEIENVSAGDEVVLLGGQSDKSISAEEIAAKLDTINYEITTRTLALLPRKIV
jgi:alanine racemase